jgi:transcriptional regulator with PAS, ATPase and Fis domain
MSPTLQAAAPSSRTTSSAGRTEDLEADIRTLAATNKDPAQLIQMGAFREDLYYRLNVISVEMPPLRERREDIPLLATNFLSLCAARAGRHAMRITPDAMEALLAHAWPGMPRLSVMERAVALATTGRRPSARSRPASSRGQRTAPEMGGSPEGSTWNR